MCEKWKKKKKTCVFQLFLEDLNNKEKMVV